MDVVHFCHRLATWINHMSYLERIDKKNIVYKIRVGFLHGIEGTFMLIMLTSNTVPKNSLNYIYVYKNYNTIWKNVNDS